MSVENFFPVEYSRLKTIPVAVGNVTIGGDNPIVLQSMTNTPTMDTEATVAQSIRMIEAGSQLVRITAPGVQDAENLAVIKAELKRQGYDVPLIADIHYQPKAAEAAARIVEKVRINPGNYTDRNIAGKVDFTDAEYNAELERIHERLKPLAKICKEYGTALRVGSNHGSLSQRIMSRYGNTPEGMAVAAMEFIQILEDLDFHKTVVSMKASNPRVMVHSVRMMVEMMQHHGTVYPIHLGVTEAGAGREGRIKSAAGIASLLEEGIGDTIRVSLTEAPEKELPVAKRLVRNHHPNEKNTEKVSLPIGYKEYKGHMKSPDTSEILAIPDEILSSDYKWITITDPKLSKHQIQEITTTDKTGIILDLTGAEELVPYRKLFAQVYESGKNIPVILKRHFSGSEKEQIYVEAGRDFGFFMLDGLGDGVMATADHLSDESLKTILLDVLQASRVRISKAEFVACPSCGRTQFNIEKALADVQAATSHLKGLTIGVMGCIVNGPGEMADADYGYVGMGHGKVALYKGRKQVMKNVPEEEAVAELVRLIESDRC